MKIKVTQEHINKGLPQTCTLCPVALAIQDAIGSSTRNVYVLKYAVEVDNAWYELPGTVSTFISYLLLNHSVQPFEFDLPL